MGALADELSRLRRGRGIMASDLQERVGPTLRTMAGIDPAGSQEETRGRLLAFLDGLTRNLPEDLGLAFSAGLALHADVRQRFLEDRMRWLADRLQRDVRTARRRVDEAIRLAEASGGVRALETSDHLPTGWYLARLRTLLRLDGQQPTAIEERTVVATDDGLTDFVISTAVPRSASAGPNGSRPFDGHGQRLGFEVMYGGSLLRCERSSGSYFRHFVRLPRPLERGESHDVGVTITTPGDQPFNPRYSFQALCRCDEFDLRIRFGSCSQPASVWKIPGLPCGMVDDFADPGALVRPDTAGDIHLWYQWLRIGLTYGARWSS